MTGVNPNDPGPESFDYLDCAREPDGSVDVDKVLAITAANEGFLGKLWSRLGWLLDHRDRPRRPERPP